MGATSRDVRVDVNDSSAGQTLGPRTASHDPQAMCSAKRRWPHADVLVVLLMITGSLAPAAGANSRSVPDPLYGQVSSTYSVMIPDSDVGRAMELMPELASFRNPDGTFELDDGRLNQLRAGGVHWRGVRPARLSLSREASVEELERAANLSDAPITDAASPDTPGEIAWTADVIDSAPSGAVITRVLLWARIEHSWVSDLRVVLNHDNEAFGTVWERDGGRTDGGFDDDSSDDTDIEIDGMAFEGDFVGMPVNGVYYLIARDYAPGDVGFIDQWDVEVYYESSSALSVTPSRRDVSADAGTTTFTVTTNEGWSVYVANQPEWIQATKTNDTTITVNYEENLDSQPREATLRVGAQGGLEEFVSVVQAEADPRFDVSPNSLSVGPAAGDHIFAVDANVGWSVEVISGSDWLAATKTSGNAFRATYTANTSTLPRQGTIRASGTGGLEEIINVEQQGQSTTLTVTPSRRDVPWPAGTTTFTVTTNVDWTVEVANQPEWIQATKTNDTTLTVDYEANLSAGPREATLRVSAQGGVEAFVTVVQSGQGPRLDVTPNSLTVGPASGESTFDADVNVAWNVEVISGGEWLSATKASGTTFVVTYSANPGAEPRQASVRAYGTGGLEEIVTVTQSGSSLDDGTVTVLDTQADCDGASSFVEVPVALTASTVGVSAFGIEIDFDTGLAFVGVRRGALTEPWQQVDGVLQSGGRIRVGGFGTTEIAAGATGVLFYLRFEVACPDAGVEPEYGLCVVETTDDLALFERGCGTLRVAAAPLADGDVNGDGSVTPADALCAFQIYLEGPGTSCARPDDPERHADVDCSGTVTPSDALCIFEFYLDGSCDFCTDGVGVLTRSSSETPEHDVELRAVGRHVVDGMVVDLFAPADVVGLAWGVDIDVSHDRMVFRGGQAIPDVARESILARGIHLVDEGRLRIGAVVTEPIESPEEIRIATLRFEALDPEARIERLRVEDAVDGTQAVTAVELEIEGGRSGTSPLLLLRSSNPSHGRVAVDVFLGPDRRTDEVALSIYDVRGRNVRTVDLGGATDGWYRVDWDGRDDQGVPVSNGTYLLRVKGSGVSLVEKVMILR